MITFSRIANAASEADYLTREKGWSANAAVKVGASLKKAIFEIESTGLEGTSYPVILNINSDVRLSNALERYLTVPPLELMERLEQDFKRDFDRVVSLLDANKIGVRQRFRLTNAIATTLSEPELRSTAEQLGSKLDRFDLDSPGDLELDQVLPAIEIPQIYIQGLDGSGQRIAVLDGEVAEHTSVTGRVAQKTSFSKFGWGEGLGNAGEEFARNHATAVATIIAGNGKAGEDETAFIGVAPGAAIWNYKIAPSTTRGSDVVAALEAAFADGIRIVNLSWGKSDLILDGSSVWSRTVDAMFALGTLVFKSAGNSGPASGTITVPADAFNVISVGAATRDGSVLHDGTSRGPTADSRAKPEIVAPGGGMYAGTAQGDFGPVISPGTSFAAPVAAGLAALLWQGFPGATATQVREAIIYSTTANSGKLAGLISGAKAFERLKEISL